MAVRLDEIKSAAERVAASHGLALVDLEFAGPAKERALRVFLEKNAEGRARLKAEIASGGDGLPERLVEGKLSVEQLSGVTHEDCAVFSRDFSVLLDVVGEAVSIAPLSVFAAFSADASGYELARSMIAP